MSKPDPTPLTIVASGFLTGIATQPRDRERALAYIAEAKAFGLSCPDAWAGVEKMLLRLRAPTIWLREQRSTFEGLWLNAR